MKNFKGFNIKNTKKVGFLKILIKLMESWQGILRVDKTQIINIRN